MESAFGGHIGGNFGTCFEEGCLYICGPTKVGSVRMVVSKLTHHTCNFSLWRSFDLQLETKWHLILLIVRVVLIRLSYVFTNFSLRLYPKITYHSHPP